LKLVNTKLVKSSRNGPAQKNPSFIAFRGAIEFQPGGINNLGPGLITKGYAYELKRTIPEPNRPHRVYNELYQ
jgi:hypothetical protein